MRKVFLKRNEKSVYFILLSITKHNDNFFYKGRAAIRRACVDNCFALKSVQGCTIICASGDGRMVKIDKESGEVTLKFKLPGFLGS